jgi:DNA-binding transcriptional ArsR family regulator
MLEQRDSLDRVFRALADPSRRAMVEQLARGPMSVSQLAEPLAMTLAGVVQHVQVLETGGIVRSQKRGRVRVCWIDPAALAGAERWIAERRAGWEDQLDRLGDVLEELADDSAPDGAA